MKDSLRAFLEDERDAWRDDPHFSAFTYGIFAVGIGAIIVALLQ